MTSGDEGNFLPNSMKAPMHSGPMRTFRYLLTSALLVGAAFVLLPAASAHPIQTYCGSSTYRVYAYPDAWANGLSGDPNSALSGLANVYTPMPCRPQTFPCIMGPGFDCHPGDPRHTPVGVDPCPTIGCNVTWNPFNLGVNPERVDCTYDPNAPPPNPPGHCTLTVGPPV